MREYAEINAEFVVGFHKRDDDRVPEFVGRTAIRVDELAIRPEIGWFFDGRNFEAPDPNTQPHNVNLDPPPESEREIVEETREVVKRILALLQPGPP